MELLQLRYFITVARMLNVSRAAQYHMIPQPAMSQTISRLEKELGKPLFDRYRNKLTLTKDGEAFLKSVTTSLGELDAAVEKMGSEDDILQGELTLLVLQQRETIADIIVAFRQKYPDVSFRIFNIPAQEDLYDYDFCITHTPSNEQYCEGKPLVTEKVQLLMSANHRLANKGAVRFEELKGEEFALPEQNSTLWNHIVHLCQQSGFEPKLSIVCRDLHCLTKFVAAGMAITLGTELSWRSIKNDSLVFVPTIPEVTRTVYVLENKRKASSRLRQTFLDFLTEYFSELQAE